MRFRDRTDAGQQLAARLQAYAYRLDVVVLGLPRGGVPVAYMVATTLHVPMDLLVVRKLGVPGEEELAMGAIASGGVRVLNVDVVHALGISDALIEAVARTEQQELERREHAYRAGKPPPSLLRGQVVIVVDDGMATGATMRVAVAAARQQLPARLVVAAPVAAVATCEALRWEVDAVVCVREPVHLGAVASWYREFPQTSDDEVCRLLDRIHATAKLWRLRAIPPHPDTAPSEAPHIEAPHHAD